MPSSHSLANLETNNNNNNNKNLIKSKSQNANFLNASNISTNSSVTGELSPSSRKSNEVVLIEKSLSPVCFYNFIENLCLYFYFNFN